MKLTSPKPAFSTTPPLTLPPQATLTKPVITPLLVPKSATTVLESPQRDLFAAPSGTTARRARAHLAPQQPAATSPQPPGTNATSTKPGAPYQTGPMPNTSLTYEELEGLLDGLLAALSPLADHHVLETRLDYSRMFLALSGICMRHNLQYLLDIAKHPRAPRFKIESCRDVSAALVSLWRDFGIGANADTDEARELKALGKVFLRVLDRHGIAVMKHEFIDGKAEPTELFVWDEYKAAKSFSELVNQEASHALSHGLMPGSSYTYEELETYLAVIRERTFGLAVIKEDTYNTLVRTTSDPLTTPLNDLATLYNIGGGRFHPEDLWRSYLFSDQRIVLPTHSPAELVSLYDTLIKDILTGQENAPGRRLAKAARSELLLRLEHNGAVVLSGSEHDNSLEIKRWTKPAGVSGLMLNPQMTGELTPTLVDKLVTALRPIWRRFAHFVSALFTPY